MISPVMFMSMKPTKNMSGRKKMIDKYRLKEDLKNGVVTVVFEKKDGTERIMRATLYDQYIPQVLSEYDGQEAKPAKQLNDDVQTVWDIDARGWRSFRYDSVKTLLRE
jgi:Fe2+ transport system protein B